MTFTEEMRNAAGSVWDEAINHRLFQEISSNNVDQAVFNNYLVIEYNFVDTASRVLGYSVAKAPSFNERQYLARGLYDLTTEQRDYFLATFDSLGVSPEKDQLSEPAQELAKGLHEHFLGVAEQEGHEEILACMLAAEWMYLTWCTKAMETLINPDCVVEWVKLHTEENFARHVRWIRQQLDVLGPKLSPERQTKLKDIFTNALQQEISFHDAAYCL